MRVACMGLIAVLIPAAVQAQERVAFDAAAVERFAALALECLHKEYPNKIAHVLNSDDDAKPPRELTPVFCGCFDWHSAVHGHWLLVRLCRQYPQAPFVARARAALDASFTREKVAAEVEYLTTEGRKTFERPYGLAWLLQLCAELHEWDDSQAREWAKVLEPLEQLAVIHTRSQDAAAQVADQLAQRFGFPRDRIWLRETGAVLSTHAGPGVIAILAVPSAQAK